MANVKIKSTVALRFEDLKAGDYFLFDEFLYLTLEWTEESEYNCYNFNYGRFEFLDDCEAVTKISSDTINITVG